MPTHVGHCVDGRGATQGFPSGLVNDTVVDLGLWGSRVPPIVSKVVFRGGVAPEAVERRQFLEIVGEGGRHLKGERVRVRSVGVAGFDQEDGDSGVFGETICQDTPGGACTHDDVVVGGTGGGGGGGGGEEAPLDRREH